MTLQRKILIAGAVTLATLIAGGTAGAQGFAGLEKKVVEKTLSNGLRVIVLPHGSAPVVSMVTYADVGGVDENQNATGLAHIFEHMAFKGTKTIGTKDHAKEAAALKKEDEAFLALRAERLRRPAPDPVKLKRLEEALTKAQDEARQYVVPNEIGDIIERAGGQGLNAGTSFDQTVYMYSLPSNKLELWAALEADRFTNPVLREFYKEKDVIMEEKRMGESQPTGRLIADFMPVAFQAHMYRSFIIGHMSDLEGITKEQAEAWFAKYYGARNLTAVVVGDVDPAQVIPMLERTLGTIPAGEKPGQVVTVEPPQRAEKRIIMEDPSQPILLIGYHKGDINDPDNAVHEAISDILGGGRSSRLYTCAGQGEEARPRRRRDHGAGPEVPRPVPLLRRAQQGQDQRGVRGGDLRGARADEEGAGHRGRARGRQGPRQGLLPRPDRLQHGPRDGAGPIREPRGVVARGVRLAGQDRQGQRGRHPTGRDHHVRQVEPDRRHDRDGRRGAGPAGREVSGRLP